MNKEMNREMNKLAQISAANQSLRTNPLQSNFSPAISLNSTVTSTKSQDIQ
jgi:hypothetical protein